MIRYFLRRIVLLVPVLLIVSFMVFTLMELAPGDILSGRDLSDMSAEEVQALRDSLGLDDPLVIKYGRYMLNLLQGNLGVTDYSGFAVWDMFVERIPNTLALAAATIVFGVVIGLPLGIFAARRAGRISDNITTAFTMVGMSMPGFWMAILAMLLFSYYLGWLPAGGFNDGIKSLIMPGVCGAMGLLAACTRQTRSSMLEVLRADYLRTARAKGVPEQVVIRKHALGNALIPIVTTIGMTIAMAVAGTAIIETVFAWPGVGRLIVEAVTARDATATTGLTILTTVMYVLILLLVDLAYAFIDPRIRAQYVSRNAKKVRNTVSGETADAPESQEVAMPVEVASTVAAQQTVAAVVQEAQPVQAEAATQSPAQSAQAEAAPAGASFVTRTEFFVDIDEESAKEETDSSISAVSKHRKRSRGAEVFRHLLRNPGAVAGMIIIVLILGCFVASLLMPWDNVTRPNIQMRFSAPSAQFPFGTDNLGRDNLSRVIYATRFSLPIGVGATAVAAIIGVFLGSIAAFNEGTIGEEIIMRLCDSLASIPGILMGMVIITTLGRSLPNLILAIGIGAVPIFIRISRASVLSIKGNEFVEAAKAIGLPNYRILFGQVLPNGIAPVIIVFTASLGAAILVSAGLSFLGFGIQLPNPEWGSLVSGGRNYIRTYPWLTTFPGLFIMITVMGFNMLGDGLRDAFDPKLKR